jgi:hypothetical protein
MLSLRVINPNPRNMEMTTILILAQMVVTPARKGWIAHHLTILQKIHLRKRTVIQTLPRMGVSAPRNFSGLNVMKISTIR